MQTLDPALIKDMGVPHDWQARPIWQGLVAAGEWRHFELVGKCPAFPDCCCGGWGEWGLNTVSEILG